MFDPGVFARASSVHVPLSESLTTAVIVLLMVPSPHTSATMSVFACGENDAVVLFDVQAFVQLTATG